MKCSVANNPQPSLLTLSGYGRPCKYTQCLVPSHCSPTPSSIALFNMEKLVGIWENSSPLALSTVILGLSTIGYVVLKSRAGPPNGLVYPPGPPQDPIIGNFRIFPKGSDDLYAAFNKWQEEYGGHHCTRKDSPVSSVYLGDIVYLRMPGVSMVVVNSFEMAYELLSKRGSTTSGRTVPYMAKELFVVLLYLSASDSAD